MTALRVWLGRPIADRDRRRAFAAAAIALLLAAVALSLIADPPDRQPTLPAPVDHPVTVRPPDPPTPPASDVPAEALDVARQFIDGYLAHLYQGRGARTIRGASGVLRRRLIAQPVRVSPGTRRQRPRVARIDGQPRPGGWLIGAEIATSTVSFPIAVVVAARRRGPVVTRLVEN